MIRAMAFLQLGPMRCQADIPTEIGDSELDVIARAVLTYGIHQPGDYRPLNGELVALRLETIKEIVVDGVKYSAVVEEKYADLNCLED